jgi:hypothetical protein
VELLLDLRQVGARSTQPLQWSSVVAGNMLRQERGAEALATCELTALRVFLPGQYAEQGRLSGAVGTNEPNARLLIYCKVKLIEDASPTIILGDISEVD